MEKILKYYKEHNITPQGETYIVTGDTYSIKEKLKELGCGYDKLLGWHSDIDLPSLSCIKINVNNYLVWDEKLERLVPKSGAETAIKNLYVGGDGAGITRGLAQAGANGVKVARAIKEKGVL